MSKKQSNAMKKMLDQFDVEFVENDDDDDEENAVDKKILETLIIQKRMKVARAAVRQFCKAFDDVDINANRLETRWKKCRNDVTEIYNLKRVVKKTVDKRGIERVFTYVSDLDNYLKQIIDVEGLPSTSFLENPELWLRVGGDGRSIYRHSNNILMVMALMDPEQPRRSHSQLFVHTLMLIDGGESHEILVDALKIVDSWIGCLRQNGYVYDGKMHTVHFVLSGDMKFIQLVKGLQGATSNYSCPLCLKPKLMKRVNGSVPHGGFRCGCEEDENMDCLHWQGPGPLRTQEMADRLHSTGMAVTGDSWTHLGHHRPAPLKNIPWSLIIMDTLHALLRITDILFGSLLEFVRQTCDPIKKEDLVMVDMFCSPII